MHPQHQMVCGIPAPRFNKSRSINRSTHMTGHTCRTSLSCKSHPKMLHTGVLPLPETSDYYTRCNYIKCWQGVDKETFTLTKWPSHAKGGAKICPLKGSIAVILLSSAKLCNNVLRAQPVQLLSPSRLTGNPSCKARHLTKTEGRPAILSRLLSWTCSATLCVGQALRPPLAKRRLNVHVLKNTTIPYSPACVLPYSWT